MIKVLFFASLRDEAQTSTCEVDALDVSNVRELVTKLSEQLPSALIDALSDEASMVSINHQYAGWDAKLSDGDEVGFLPPVSGG